MLTACMKEKGWEVKPAGDGTFSLDAVALESFDEFSSAQVQCSDGLIDRPLPTREIAAELYVHALDTAACLRAAGYELSLPVPSEAEYIDAWLDHEKADWIPFGDVLQHNVIDEISYAALYTKCPQDGPQAVAGF